MTTLTHNPASGLTPDEPQTTANHAWVAASLILLACAAASVWQSVRNHSDVDHTAGTWSAMATDLAAGELYRPVLGADGSFGGTRYMPLHAVLHAGLIRAGVPVVPAGMAIGLASGVALAAAVRATLRALGVPPAVALAGAALVFAAPCVQSAMATTKGDLLAAALGAWGVATVARHPNAPRRAGLLFALAFLTKFTAVFGLLACVAWLWTTARRRDAVALAVTACGAAVLGTSLAMVASGGRMADAFLACAAAGATAADVLRAPLTLATFLTVWDPIVGVTLLAAGAAWAAAGRWGDRGAGDAGRLVLFNVVATFAVTQVIYASPGAHRNHLIDLHAAAVLVLAVGAARLAARPTPVMSTVAVVGALFSVLTLPQASHAYDRSHAAAARAAVAGVAGPVLAQQPLFAIDRGERPAVLDAFALRVIGSSRADVRDALAAQVRGRRFGAVVLMQDPADRAAFARSGFGEPFVDHLLAAYAPAGTFGGYRVYRPIEIAPPFAVSPPAVVASPIAVAPPTVVAPPALQDGQNNGDGDNKNNGDGDNSYAQNNGDGDNIYAKDIVPVPIMLPVPIVLPEPELTSDALEPPQPTAAPTRAVKSRPRIGPTHARSPEVVHVQD